MPLRIISTALPPPPGPERSLGDKLQWLAIARPTAARLLERLVDRYLERYRDGDDGDAA